MRFGESFDDRLILVTERIFSTNGDWHRKLYFKYLEPLARQRPVTLFIFRFQFLITQRPRYTRCAQEIAKRRNWNAHLSGSAPRLRSLSIKVHPMGLWEMSSTRYVPQLTFWPFFCLSAGSSVQTITAAKNVLSCFHILYGLFATSRIFGGQLIYHFRMFIPLALALPLHRKSLHFDTAAKH